MNFTIKKLVPADWATAKQFLIWNREDDSEKAIPGDDYLARLLAQETFHLLVALNGERIVGGLTAYELPMYQTESVEMFLYEIGVDEACQREGIASGLIAELKKICREKGIQTLFVGTEKQNQPAKKLYEKTGATLEEIAWYTYHLS